MRARNMVGFLLKDGKLNITVFPYIQPSPGASRRPPTRGRGRYVAAGEGYDSNNLFHQDFRDFSSVPEDCVASPLSWPPLERPY